MLGAEEEKESNVTFKKGTRESCINVIKYFQEITEYIRVWRHTLTIRATAHRERRWMDGERQRIELSKVSPESFRSAMSRRAGQD